MKSRVDAMTNEMVRAMQDVYVAHVRKDDVDEFTNEFVQALLATVYSCIANITSEEDRLETLHSFCTYLLNPDTFTKDKVQYDA